MLVTALSASLGLFAYTVLMEGYFARRLFLWERGLDNDLRRIDTFSLLEV